MKKSIILSMAALMSLVSTAAFAADKTLGFDDLYNNPKAITQAMQESNAQLPVSVMEKANVPSVLKELNTTSKIVLINFLGQSNQFAKESEFLKDNLSNSFLYNDNIFTVVKKDNANLKTEYLSINEEIIKLAKTAYNLGIIHSQKSSGIKFDMPYDPAPTWICKKEEERTYCGIKSICDNFATGVDIASQILGILGRLDKRVMVVSFIGHSLTEKFVCPHIPDCVDYSVCTEWEFMH